MRKFRLLLAVFIGLALVALIAFGRWRKPPGVDVEKSADAKSASDECGKCHRAVWEQWQASFHSKAWADPNVQAAFEHFGSDRKCHSCHAPAPVLVTGLGEPVELRGRDLPSGVNCLSCHRLSEGSGVAARRTLPDAPCRPVQRSQFLTSKFCGACHESIYEDWAQSGYADEDTTCHDCHMPADLDRPGGRGHLFLGGHEAAVVISGASMACRQERDELVVTVTNDATGHNFPGERHNRILLVQVVQRAADGRITLTRQHVIKGITPFRGESSADEIRAGSTFVTRFPVVEPPVTAEIRLLYKAFPWYDSQDALVVHRATLGLKEP